MNPQPDSAATAEALKQKILDRYQHLDKGILRDLSALKKIAVAENDDALIGFVYYHQANVCYRLELGYQKYRQYLRKALHHLSLSGDVLWLTRAYNLVGIDAYNNGSYDVAYYYYMMAYRACENLENTYLAGLVNANIGQIYAHLGSPKTAIRYMRRSNRLMRGHTEDIYYYHNMITHHYMIGILHVRLGHLKEAKKSLASIDVLLKQSGGKGIMGVRISILLLQTTLALAQGDEKNYRKNIDDLLRLPETTHHLYDNIDEIADFCKFLLEKGKLQPVRRLLDLIRDTVEASGVIHMAKMISDIEVAYYKKKGDKRLLTQHLQVQYEMSTRQEDERQRIYLYSIELIDEMNALRKDQQQMRSKNITLQMQAETDALTGIPNRLAMNRMLDEAYEKAYKAGHSFCIEILDIDYFKEFNDTYGHGAGDDCLVKIAAELFTLSRRQNISCARYGGDEFVMIYENMSDKEVREVARELDQKILALRIPHKNSQSAPFVTVSQGLCNAVPRRKNKLWDFMAEADTALYTVKRNRMNAKERQPLVLKHPS